MGIFHFAGLGKSPGAITASLSYLKEENSKQYGEISEGLVIFTSPEIKNGEEEAYKSFDNEYMTRNIKKWTGGLKNSFEIVKKFLQKEFNKIDVYVCKVEVNDFSKCFEIIGKSLLKLHKPGTVGKHIWGNLTGGTNILNAALIQIAYITGFIPILYYTFVANLKKNGKYLKPFSKEKSEFDFRKIHVFKTNLDNVYLNILKILNEYGDWIKDEDLLAQLKNRGLLSDIDREGFRRDFLNTMDIDLERKENCNRLSKYGKERFDIIQSPLFRTLTRQNSISSNEISELIKDLSIEKIEL